MSERTNNFAGAMTLIGVAAPLSGRGQALGREMVQAARLAVEDANASGGVGGAAVEFVEADDRGDEAAGAEIARAFVADPHLLAVVGHYNSNVTLRAAPIYAEAGLLLMNPIVSNPRLTLSGWSNVFRFTNRDDITTAALAKHLAGTLGKRRVAIVETRTTFGRSMADEFARAFAAQGGDIVMRRGVEEGTDAFADLVAATPADADLVFYGGTYEGAPLLRALRAAGRPMLFAAGDGCWDVVNFLAPAGEAAEQGEGVVVLSACPEIGRVAGAADFAARYEARFGTLINYAVNAFDATRLAIATLSAASAQGAPPSRSAVVAATREVHHQGVAYPQPIAWTRGGDNRAAVTALHVVKGGRYVQVASSNAW